MRRLRPVPAEVIAAARDGFAIVHRKHKTRQQRYGPERADVDEVFAVLHGEVECVVAGRWRPAPAGTLVCVARGRVWGVRARRGGAGEVRLLNIIFSAAPGWWRGAPSAPTALPGPWWRRLVELEQGAEYDAHGQRVVRLADVLAFVAALARALGAGARAAGGPARADTAADWMAAWTAAQDVIAERAAAGLTTAALARAVHCSATQLRRVFHAAAGISPKAAITAWRVERAKRLLAAGRMTATQVAAAVGFATVQRFHAVFRRATGVTPGAWARRG